MVLRLLLFVVVVALLPLVALCRRPIVPWKDLEMTKPDLRLFTNAIHNGDAACNVPPSRWRFPFFLHAASKLKWWWTRFRSFFSFHRRSSSTPSSSLSSSLVHGYDSFVKIDDHPMNLTESLLRASVSINNRPTVFIVPFNYKWIDVAHHVQCSLHLVHHHKILFWALDEKAYKEAKNRGWVTYFDPTLYSTSKQAELGSLAYQKLMNERPTFWVDVLARGFDMVFIDADIVVVRDLAKHLERHLTIAKEMNGGEDVDMMIQTDAFHFLTPKDGPKVQGCAGFFYMRSSKRSIVLMKRLKSFLKLFGRYRDAGQVQKRLWTWNDQSGLNFLLSQRGVRRLYAWNWNPSKQSLLEDDDYADLGCDYDKFDIYAEKGQGNDYDFSVLFLDQLEFMNGHLFFKRPSHVRSRLERHPEKSPILIHANGEKDKFKSFRKVGLYFFDDFEMQQTKKIDGGKEQKTGEPKQCVSKFDNSLYDLYISKQPNKV